MDRMLTTEEAARRLGVKVPTLYAYVSRGLLESHPDPARRGQPLRPRRRRGAGDAEPGRPPDGDPPGHHHDRRDPARPGARPPLPRPGRHRAGAALAASKRWPSSSGSPRNRATGPRPTSAPARSTPTLDRMRWALVLCGATDPLRSDLRPAAVARAARRATAALTDVVGPRPAGEASDGSVAARLAARLTPTAAAVPAAAVNAALVLLADHELATSTMAVRVAASVRADPYDALLAGLATLAGPLHGGASQLAYELLVVAERDGVPRALNDVLRSADACPGSATPSTRAATPRFAALLDVGRAAAERRASRHPARGHRAGRRPRRAAGQLRPRPGRAELGHRHAARHGRTHLRRGPGGGVGRPLHGGADRAAAALPGPRRLQRLKPLPRAAKRSDQPGPMTMADGCPPRWRGRPTFPVASVTGTSVPACCVTHAVVPSALKRDALGHVGQGDRRAQRQADDGHRDHGRAPAHVGRRARRRRPRCRSG